MADEARDHYRPQMSRAGLAPTHTIIALDEYGQPREIEIAGERPLTLYLDKREIVTLMTLGSHPEALALGYLRNQGFVDDIRRIKAVQVDWEVGACAVITVDGAGVAGERLERRTVTTGCGQGTVFGDLMEKLAQVRLPRRIFKQSLIYRLLRNISAYNEVYKQAGAVHGCALCQEERILYFVEDVGRHNAVDAIAGQMWLDGDVCGGDKIFYTTGRLTSEMVIKVAQMGIPLLLSRSGLTRMGLEIAQTVGVTLIGRAKGQHFLVYHGGENIEYDARPPPRPSSSPMED
ncbi:MAG TPA: formate dehydrogenase accessory sulfurtransferase FdhD [Candidatus Competibacteraceae bacterium]|nr:formate dehydrogenase accessory sulfurtransferase FdhD [Candidatus Competibacteraceae bacterium]